MSAASDFAQMLKLTPEGAAAFLVARGQLTKTFSWQELWQDEHNHQFTISRLARLDLLEALRAGIVASVDGDLSRRDWMQDAEELLRGTGWWGKKAVTDPSINEIVYTTFDPARLKLIYDTNTRQAYSAGLWQRVQDTKLTHPYVRYITKDDGRVRPAHAAWNNLTLPADDSFWSTHWPPNGWRCRCRVMSMTKKDYDQGAAPTGAALKKAAPEVLTKEFINQRTGEVSKVPAGIDPGFGYNPGAARKKALQDVVDGKLKSASPGIASAARKAGL